MRINTLPPTELFTKYIHVQNKQTAFVSASAVDKTELTSEAKTFSSTLKAAKEAMSVRTPAQTERINQIAQQIRDNTYSVSGKDVARKMLGK